MQLEVDRLGIGLIGKRARVEEGECFLIVVFPGRCHIGGHVTLDEAGWLQFAAHREVGEVEEDDGRQQCQAD